MKQNGVVYLPGPALLFFLFRFEYLIPGPSCPGIMAVCRARVTYEPCTWPGLLRVPL